MILTIIAFILILTVLVVVHEYGHFLVARLCGIKIKEFAIGFGPKLFTWMRKHDTEFNVRAYPLGGFVAMEGESLEEMEVVGGFQSQPAWKRFLVVFAGPFFSFLFAVLVFISIGYFIGYPTGETSNKVQMVLPQTKANKIGLRAGDEIVSLDGVSYNDGSYIDKIHNNPGKEMTLKVKRGKENLTFKASPDLALLFMHVSVKESPSHNGVVFENVDRSSELYKKGVVTNDVLISVNGKDVNSTFELRDILSQNEGKKLSMVIQAGGSLRTVNIDYVPYTYALGNVKVLLPEMYLFTENENEKPSFGIEQGDKIISVNGVKISNSEDLKKLNDTQIKSLIVLRHKETVQINISKEVSFKSVYLRSTGAFGFIPGTKLEKMGFLPSVKVGCAFIGRILVELFKVLTTREIKDNVGGPIAIVSATNTAVKTGFFDVIILMGGLSLSLAVINLLPIPVLDGGHIFVMFLEWIRRKRFTKEQLTSIQFIGLLIIVFIFVAVMYSDISKLFTGGLPK